MISSYLQAKDAGSGVNLNGMDESIPQPIHSVSHKSENTGNTAVLTQLVLNMLNISINYCNLSLTVTCTQNN